MTSGVPPAPGGDATREDLRNGRGARPPAGWQPGLRVGDWTILRKLGQGGMGAVFEAEHVESRERVAIKTVELDADAAARARFAREGQAQAAIPAHRNALRVRSAGGAHGAAYLVMDLAPGGDLKARLKDGPMAPRDVARLGRDLGRALAHCHRHGVLHRDLKPANVMFDGPGPEAAPLLVDFGLARLAGAERLTRTGTTMGTPAYMSPEQAGGERADERADVYGLAAVLYHALLGRPPFDGSSDLSIIKQVLTDAPPAPRSLRPDVPADLEAVLLRALEKDPVARHATASALADDLERVLRGESLAGAPRSRLALVLVPSLVLVLVLVLVAAAGGTPATPALPTPALPAPAPGPVARPAGPASGAFLDVDPALPPELREWAIVGPSSRSTTVRVASQGEVRLVARHRPRGRPASELVSRRLEPSPGAPVEVPLEVGWNELTLASGATVLATRSIVRLPAGLDPVVADGPWLEVVRDARDASDVEPDRLVLVPPGETGVSLALDGEVPGPGARTNVPDPYLLGRFEVSRRQLRAACATGALVGGKSLEDHEKDPPGFDPGRLPAVFITLGQAEAYCAARGLRLPRYDEWERAFRGGAPGTRYPWGDAWDVRRLNRRQDAAREPGPHEEDVDGFVSHPAPVGSFPAGASRFGALDLAGNASEWVARVRADPVDRGFKLGGAWDVADARHTWPAYAAEKAPSDAGDRSLGFRVARSVDEDP